MKTTLRLLTAVTLALFAAGCASTSTPKNTRALKVQSADTSESHAYRTVTVIPFDLAADAQQADPRFGENFAGDLVAQLRSDYAGVFEEVRWNRPAHAEGEVIVSGTIQKYKPGSADARFLMAGLGAASFQGEFILKDGQDGRVLLHAPFDKLWAWGGMLGASKTIDHMVAQTSVAIAKTIALWKQGELERE